MKRLSIFLAIIVVTSSLFSCKKTVDKKAEDYIIDVMTDGKWYMYEYQEEGVDHTFEFNGFEFQFHKNGTVDATRDNVVKTGTWKGDLSTYSITAQFTTAGEPLTKLNNTWKIKDSYVNAVFAEAHFGTALNKIQLVKR